MKDPTDPMIEFWGTAPRHPDSVWLSQQVLANDARSYEPGFTIGDWLTKLPINPESLNWMATNRAQMAIDHLRESGMARNLPLSTRLAVRTLLGGMYLDGFSLGTAYGRKLAAEGR